MAEGEGEGEGEEDEDGEELPDATAPVVAARVDAVAAEDPGDPAGALGDGAGVVWVDVETGATELGAEAGAAATELAIAITPISPPRRAYAATDPRERAK